MGSHGNIPDPPAYYGQSAERWEHIWYYNSCKGTLYVLLVLHWWAAHFEIRSSCKVSDKLRRFLQITQNSFISRLLSWKGCIPAILQLDPKRAKHDEIAKLINKNWNLSFLTAVPTHSNSDKDVPCCASSSLHSFLSLRKPSMTDTWARICAVSLTLSFKKNE